MSMRTSRFLPNEESVVIKERNALPMLIVYNKLKESWKVNEKRRNEKRKKEKEEEAEGYRYIYRCINHKYLYKNELSEWVIEFTN